MTRRNVPKVGLVLILFGAISHAFCQDANREKTPPGSNPSLKGKSTFEVKCATCHGLDGLGGEHAPDIAHQPTVKALSDQALLDLIHDGIPESGMPAFSNMSREDSLAVIAYLRSLQGKPAADSVQGDSARGRDLFFGKAGCSACHVMRGQGQLVAGDLTGFSRIHDSVEIRDAILRPETFAGGRQEAATAVAKDGQVFSGMIRNEDNSSLQLQDTDGRFYLLMKSSLVSVRRRAGGSMHIDYGQRLSIIEIDDLVSYILRGAQAPDIPSSTSTKDGEPHTKH